MACIMMARDLGLSNVEIESDSKQAISLSVFELVPPCEGLALVPEIRKLACDVRRGLIGSKQGLLEHCLQSCFHTTNLYN